MVLWEHSNFRPLMMGETIDGASRDAGNTNFLSTHRAGMIMGKLDAAPGKLKEWNADLADGTENIYGVLGDEHRSTDFDANDLDKDVPVVIRGALKASQLLIEGTAFTSHLHEHLARRVLVRSGSVFDDDPQGYLSGLIPRYKQVTGTADTLTVAENGYTISYSSGSAVDVTLPTIRPGISYSLLREGDQDFTLTGSNNIIVGNDLAASTVKYDTASERKGATFYIRSIFMGTTLLWQVDIATAPIGTGHTWTWALT